jgi:small-conductance mechanosensitive channel
MRNLRHLLERDPMAMVWPVVIFVATLAVGWVIRAAVLRGLRAWTRRSGSRAGAILLDALRGPMLIWCLILGVHLALQSSELPWRYTVISAKVLLALWILSLTIMFMRVAGDLVHNFGDQVPGALPVTTLSESLAKMAVLILGLVLMLRNAFDIEVTPILTALGVGGLAVALALQDTLANLFAGVYVAMAKQIRLGDYIKLNTGEEGYVTDIGWRSTTIRALANNMVLIPNNKLAQAIVTNYYLPARQMAASLQVGVSYASDLDQIERVLLETAQKGVGEIKGMVGEPAPSVAFDPGFGDSALLFTVSFQVAEFADQFAVRSELRRRLARRFREEGIEIPFPTRTVRWERPGAGT